MNSGRLLLVAATTGYQTRAFAEAAQRVGLDVTLATDRCHVLENPWGDQAVPLRFENPEASAAALAALQPRPSAVIAVGDRPAEIAARAAVSLGLPFHSPQAVMDSRNKFRTRERLQAAHLPVPDYALCPVTADPAEAARAAAFPCVLKPLGLSGSRGVIRANDREEFQAAFARIRALLNLPEIARLRAREDRHIQVESYIEGREFAVEAVMTAGSLQVLAIFDKPDPLVGPFFEETLYITPSRESAGVQEQIGNAVRAAANALGLSHGPVHAEVRFGPCGVFVLEAAARPIGGLCARSLRFQNGMTLEELLIRHAVGEDVTRFSIGEDASGVMMIPIPKSGLYVGVQGIEAAGKVEGVEDVEITAKPGQSLLQLPEGSSYLGFVFARAKTPGKAETALRRAHECLRFEIVTELEVVRPA